MKGKNYVELIGYIGAVPEFINIHNEKHTLVCRLSVGTHDDFSQNKDDTTWHRVTFLGKNAEILQKLEFNKGAGIQIEGHLTYHQYPDKKYDDVTHYSTEIVCDRFQLLPSSKNIDYENTNRSYNRNYGNNQPQNNQQNRDDRSYADDRGYADNRSNQNNYRGSSQRNQYR